MNHRQRMLAAMRGEPTDQIPWAPRMELWNIAVRARGTAPPHLANMNTAQLADALDVGCHAVRADYSIIARRDVNAGVLPSVHGQSLGPRGFGSKDRTVLRCAARSNTCV